MRTKHRAKNDAQKTPGRTFTPPKLGVSLSTIVGLSPTPGKLEGFCAGDPLIFLTVETSDQGIVNVSYSPLLKTRFSGII